MQSVRSRIWTRVAVSISYDDNDYTTGTSTNFLCWYQHKCPSITEIVSNRLIGLVGRVFANGPGVRGSVPGRVIPKTLKMVLDSSLLNTQQYKVRIKGKVGQSREKSSAFPFTLVL